MRFSSSAAVTTICSWFSHPWAFLKVLRTYEGSVMDRPEVVAAAAVGIFAYLHFVMPPAVPRRRWSVHPINSNRNKTGEFHTLVKELMYFGPKFYTYFRMTRESIYIMYYGTGAIAVMRSHMSNSVEDSIACRWTHVVVMTSLLRKNYIKTSFTRNNGVNISSYGHCTSLALEL